MTLAARIELAEPEEIRAEADEEFRLSMAFAVLASILASAVSGFMYWALPDTNETVLWGFWMLIVGASIGMAWAEWARRKRLYRIADRARARAGENGA